MFGLNNFRIFPNNNARFGLDIFFIKQHFIYVNVMRDSHILNQFCQTKIRVQWIFTKLCIFIDKHVTLICVKSYKCTPYNKEDREGKAFVSLWLYTYCATDHWKFCFLHWTITVNSKWTLKILKFQLGVDIRVKICAWHWLLITLKTMLIKLQRHFHQITLAFIGHLKSQLSDGFLRYTMDRLTEPWKQG